MSDLSPGGQAKLPQAQKGWMRAVPVPRLGTAHGKAQSQARARKVGSHVGTQSVRRKRGGLGRPGVVYHYSPLYLKGNQYQKPKMGEVIIS